MMNSNLSIISSNYNHIFAIDTSASASMYSLQFYTLQWLANLPWVYSYLSTRTYREYTCLLYNVHCIVYLIAICNFKFTPYFRTLLIHWFFVLVSLLRTLPGSIFGTMNPGFTSAIPSFSSAPSMNGISSTLPLMPVISSSALSSTFIAPGLSAVGESSGTLSSTSTATATAAVDSKDQAARTRTTSSLALATIPIQPVISFAFAAKQLQRPLGVTTTQSPLTAAVAGAAARGAVRPTLMLNPTRPPTSISPIITTLPRAPRPPLSFSNPSVGSLTPRIMTAPPPPPPLPLHQPKLPTSTIVMHPTTKIIVGHTPAAVSFAQASPSPAAQRPVLVAKVPAHSTPQAQAQAPLPRPQMAPRPPSPAASSTPARAPAPSSVSAGSSSCNATTPPAGSTHSAFTTSNAPVTAEPSNPPDVRPQVAAAQSSRAPAANERTRGRGSKSPSKRSWWLDLRITWMFDDYVLSFAYTFIIYSWHLSVLSFSLIQQVICIHYWIAKFFTLVNDQWSMIQFQQTWINLLFNVFICIYLTYSTYLLLF